MAATIAAKRQNFNITSEQEAELFALQADFAAPTAKDTILKAVHLARVLAVEIKNGKRIGLIDRQSGKVIEIILPELEAALAQATTWVYLVPRPHAWKKQLFVKGRKLTAANVWRDMLVNQMSQAEAAENWDLPDDAIGEIVAYCEANRALLRVEAEEEKLRLLQQGVKLAPMKLLLDEDSQGRVFIRLLREAGHDVLTIHEAGLTSKPDGEVFAYAKQTGRVLLTRNVDDFLALHQADPAHSGILMEYQDDDPAKNMTAARIVEAMGRIEASGWGISGVVVSVNAWR